MYVKISGEFNRRLSERKEMQIRICGKKMEYRFEDILEIRNGKNQKAVENPEGRYPIYGSGGVIGYADDYICEADTIIIGRKGSINNPIYASEPFWNVDTAFGLSVKKDFVLPRYLYYFCKRFDFEKLNKTVTIPSLTKSDLLKIKINLPVKDEQQAIIDRLMKIESIMEFRKTELDYLDVLIKARFVEMFGSIYDGKFDMKTLPDIVCDGKNSIKRGPFGGALKKDDFVDEGYLIYEQRHAIHNDFKYAKYYITQEKYEDMIGFKVVPGDLIISCSGVTLGRIAEVPEGAKEGIINQALLKISLNQEVMLNTFFIQQFRGEEIQEILFGFSRGSGIPNMPSMSEVKAVEFICPPLELQKQYCDFVHQVNKSKVAVQKALDETQILFDSLMQKYFG